MTENEQLEIEIADLKYENKNLKINLNACKRGRKQLVEENEQLKFQLQNTSYQRDEFHRGARENANRVGKLERENEWLKQYKQSVSDVLLSWSQKNLTAKQLQVVIAIMEELNILGDVE